MGISLKTENYLTSALRSGHKLDVNQINCFFNLLVIGEGSAFQGLTHSSLKSADADLLFFMGCFSNLCICNASASMIHYIAQTSHSEIAWMCDISLRRIEITGELFQGHLGPASTEWGYAFSVHLSAASLCVSFREDTAELGWFPAHCRFLGICCNKWILSLS